MELNKCAKFASNRAGRYIKKYDKCPNCLKKLEWKFSIVSVISTDHVIHRCKQCEGLFTMINGKLHCGEVKNARSSLMDNKINKHIICPNCKRIIYPNTYEVIEKDDGRGHYICNNCDNEIFDFKGIL